MIHSPACRVASATAWLIGLVLVGGCSPANPGPLHASAAPERIILEGLPHESGEPKNFAAERASGKPQTDRVGYWFYARPVKLTPAELQTLTRLVDDPRTYETFAGEKKCGGFHPDYAVEWPKGATTRTVLLCFTCGEAKILGGPKGTERFDLARSAKTALSDLLHPHHPNRPARLPGEGAG